METRALSEVGVINGRSISLLFWPSRYVLLFLTFREMAGVPLALMDDATELIFALTMCSAFPCSRLPRHRFACVRVRSRCWKHWIKHRQIRKGRANKSTGDIFSRDGCIAHDRRAVNLLNRRVCLPSFFFPSLHEIVWSKRVIPQKWCQKCYLRRESNELILLCLTVYLYFRRNNENSENSVD